MEDNTVKKNSMMIEQIFDIVCLIASYGILFLLPQKMDVFFYRDTAATALILNNAI